MVSIELLSPARNLECGIEAVRHGADAVYIGAPRFGARAAAGNSVEDIAELVRFAHPYGVKIYVTVNTLLHDEELPEVDHLIGALAEVGVDALIVQDERLMELNRGRIPLHASTQMDNRTVEDVRARQSAGYTQTVLARELSLDDIRAIHAAVPEMPLEAFVHGALCVSYSGRCYASEYCFGRSANRGECAQFCRLPFDLIDADGRIVTNHSGVPQRQRHLLSLKDMNRVADLEAMMDAGITSFKIEGRLKDVAYVKNITAYYRQRIDAIIARRPDDYCRSSFGVSTVTFTPNPLKSFNRGFTDYYLHGRTSAPVYQPLTPKSLGEPVGHVKEIVSFGNPSLSVAGTATFANGDGLCFFAPDGHLQGFRVNRIDQQGRLFPADPSVLASLRKGMSLYRNVDAAFERELSRPSADRRIPIRWLLEETEDGFKLTLKASASCPSTFRSPLGACDASLCEELSTFNYPLSTLIFPYPHELARTPQEDNIRRQLTRLGDTPYTCTEEDVEIRLSDNWFIPASVLGEWRRQVVGDFQDSPPALPVREGVVTSPELPSITLTKVFAPSLTGRAGGESSWGESSWGESSWGESAPLMTCRHCLRFALGYCTRDGHRLPFAEPLSLRLSDGRTFPLAFDCKACEMQVLSGGLGIRD